MNLYRNSSGMFRKASEKGFRERLPRIPERSRCVLLISLSILKWPHNERTKQMSKYFVRSDNETDNFAIGVYGNKIVEVDIQQGYVETCERDNHHFKFSHRDNQTQSPSYAPRRLHGDAIGCTDWDTVYNNCNIVYRDLIRITESEFDHMQSIALERQHVPNPSLW